jgi:hypothetical protein
MTFGAMQGAMTAVRAEQVQRRHIFGDDLTVPDIVHHIRCLATNCVVEEPSPSSALPNPKLRQQHDHTSYNLLAT